MKEKIKPWASLSWLAVIIAALAGCGGGSSSSSSAEREAPGAIGDTTTAWTQCAVDPGYCNGSGTRVIRFGLSATSNYVEAVKTGSVWCDISSFGGTATDPAPGQRKSCWEASGSIGPSTANTTSSSNWQYCSGQDQPCTFSGTRLVRFGLSTSANYVDAQRSGNIWCDIGQFGGSQYDPAPGQRKTCWISNANVGPTATASTASGPGFTQTTTSPGAFNLGQRPFSASSSWNRPIPTWASYSWLPWPAATGGNYWVNWESYSPAVHVGRSSDPLVQIPLNASWGWPAQTIWVRLPAGVTGAPGSDGEILMIDGTTVHNCWQFVRTSDTTGRCSAYARADVVNGSGWGSKSPFLAAGIVATGSSQLAGLLVQAETDAGEIEHALHLAVDYMLQRSGIVGEAIHSDAYNDYGFTQEGDRLAIPPGAAMPAGLSPLGQKVFRALQKYGAFNVDVAIGTTSLRAQTNAYDWGSINALRNDVSRLIPLLQRVQFY
jgi:hypothetical protein